MGSDVGYTMIDQGILRGFSRLCRDWFYTLALCVILMEVFICVVAPFIEKQVAPFKELSGFIDEHDVNTDAYSYTGSELAAQAALGARSTVEHPYRGPNR